VIAELEPSRLWAAAGLVAAYATMCAGIVWRHRRHAAPPVDDGHVLVLHASQTGRAEHLAAQTAARLQAAGTPARLLSLAELDPAELAHTRRALWIVSTTGEGDPPDPALPFLKRVAQEQARRNGHLSEPWPPFMLLALGDRRYEAFCAFGEQVEALCHAHGAQPLAPRIELDGDDPANLARWWAQLAPLGAAGAEADAALDDQTLASGAWRLSARQWVNPGSSGAPLYQLDLTPSEGQNRPAWQPGDLALVQVPDAAGVLQAPRSYSIASLPSEPTLRLLVRLQSQADGTPGLASGWLCQQAPLDTPVALTLRAHPRFHAAPEDLAQPALFIGGGSGLAGLRGHLAARAEAAARGEAVGPGWLIYGERHAAHDRPCEQDLARWLRGGTLQRLDRVFSRDAAPGAPRHVQQQLLAEGARVQEWLARGGRIYVCGSLTGLGQGLDQALQQLLGEPALAELAAQGRYKRDLY